MHVLMSIGAITLAQDDPLPKATEVQSKLEQWVKTRQLISAESSAWETERNSLAELNEIRLRETAQLDEFIDAAGERVGEIAKKRAAFSQEESDLKTWRSELETRLSQIEAKLLPLIPRFPAPLREKVEESLLRLESPSPDVPLQNRTRDALLVLQAYLDFQNRLTLDTEAREIAGTKREVDILYLGMSQAWYADASGRHAGHGYPGNEGWVWTEANSIGGRVRNAINIHTRSAAPAFVELPLTTEKVGTPSGEAPKTP